MIEAGNPGVVLGGRVYIGPTLQPHGAPILDGCTTHAHRADGTPPTRFRGVVITPSAWRSRGRYVTGWAFGLRGDGPPPIPAQWRWAPRWLVRMRG